MLTIPSEMLENVIAHARECVPHEACGVIIGPGDSPASFYRIRNVSPDPNRYEMEPAELYRVILECDRRGWQLQVIYHSHPRGDAFPSRTDIDLAFYTEALYLIVSLQIAAKPTMRGFRIVDGLVTEEGFRANPLVDREQHRPRGL